MSAAPASSIEDHSLLEHTRRRPDRVRIRDAWIELAVHHPLVEKVQRDGRIQRWAFIPETTLC